MALKEQSNTTQSTLNGPGGYGLGAYARGGVRWSAHGLPSFLISSPLLWLLSRGGQGGQRVKQL